MHCMVLYKFIYLFYQSNNKHIKYLIKIVILRRYILIFALALISCAGTQYIHSFGASDSISNVEHQIENQVVEMDLDRVSRATGVMKNVQLN